MSKFFGACWFNPYETASVTSFGAGNNAFNVWVAKKRFFQSFKGVAIEFKMRNNPNCLASFFAAIATTNGE
ncbi:hypothetical protein RYZ27_12190 [Hyphomonas sp. FCG-A18]|uniref:hypothetical protein n=1 Tax=Hyphomonas sp. FCG-A18 TaxID=3080019 RepID=UPI002B2DBBAE|nr:hypothetical protein RYZ27_12190 [Hyphomonas sp. FCG-A18]